MPVVPAFVAIGSAMGASAATAATVGAVTTMTAVSVGAQGYSMIQQNKASKASAQLAKDSAGYNAKVDLSEAKQTQLDSDANIRAARRDAAVYTSRQQAAYATSGVLSGGSPLLVEAESAGRMEQSIQQERVNSQREVAKRESAARIGVLYGDAQSSAIKKQNSIDMLKGGVGILQTVAGAYQAGVFSTSGGSGYAAAAKKGFLF